MNKTNVLLLVILMAFSGVLRGDEKHIPGSGKRTDFVGKWVSTNMHGGALAFVISKIECDFDKDGDFEASVVYTDGSKSSVDGKYSVDKDYMFAVEDGKKDPTPYKLRYWFVDPSKTMLAIRDENFGMTLVLTRAADADDDSSSGGFF